MIEASKNSGLEVNAAAAYWSPLSGIDAEYVLPSRSPPNSEAGLPVSTAPAWTRSAATASVTGWLTGATAAGAGTADAMVDAAAVATRTNIVVFMGAPYSVLGSCSRPVKDGFSTLADSW